MKLFPDDPGAAAFESKSIYLPPAPPPEVTAQAFETWPPHMQTEFAALAYERGTQTVTLARRKIGVTAMTLDEISTRRHRFMLPQVQGYHVDDDAPADPHRNPKKSQGRG